MLLFAKKTKGFFVLRKWKSVINSKQLYTGYKDFKNGKIKSYVYLIILRKYVSCRVTYKWLKIILCFCHVHKVIAAVAIVSDYLFPIIVKSQF